ncbi:MAG: hypothetical protein QFB87_04340 [Patescibacteria group bacterium]|nr:hypothetical protein [Patescibacteria group bacterium]
MSEIDVKDQTSEPTEVAETTAPVATTATENAPAAETSVPKSTEVETAKPVETTSAPVVDAPVVKKSRAKYGHYAAEAILLLAVVVLGLQVASAKSDTKNLQTQLATVQQNPQALVQKQSDDLIARVGSLMKLPTGETPTVAAVSDAAAAAKQSAFFANAQNGDKVLMYVKAGEAILYRPTTNKIILVAPLTFNNAQATSTTPAPSTAPATKR